MIVSVIICTHNPREEYLRRVLESLHQQTLPKDQWELLLIDNASKEPLSKKYDLSWHPDARHLREEELGLTPTRLRGIREAIGSVLVFVDDDNVLDKNYLSISRDLIQRHPFLGVIGAANIIPEFETPPAPELAPYLPMLALRQQTRGFWSNNPTDGNVPWGAGMVVARQVAAAHLDVVDKSHFSKQLGRRGSELNSCEDDEFSWTACKLGLGKGIFPELIVTHLIEKHRVEQEYLLKIAEGHSYSRTILNHLHGLIDLEPRYNPSFSKVLVAFLSLSISRFFFEGHCWWQDISRLPIEKAFIQAQRRGVRKALKNLPGECLK